MRKAFRPFSCAATSEGTSAVGQTKDGSSSVLLRKQNVRLPFIWGKIGYFAHRKNGVDLFYFHVDVPDKKSWFPEYRVVPSVTCGFAGFYHRGTLRGGIRRVFDTPPASSTVPLCGCGAFEPVMRFYSPSFC